jgi:hypothetical protein
MIGADKTSAATVAATAAEDVLAGAEDADAEDARKAAAIFLLPNTHRRKAISDRTIPGVAMTRAGRNKAGASNRVNLAARKARVSARHLLLRRDLRTTTSCCRVNR